jgi:hypothetical protein
MRLYTTPAELLRRGGANPGSLRPAGKDRETGVSCFETEAAMKKALADTPNPIEPDDIYVVLDSSKFWGVNVVRDAAIEGHWLIRPSDPAEMDSWVKDRPTHRLTAMLQAAIIKPVRKFR